MDAIARARVMDREMVFEMRVSVVMHATYQGGVTFIHRGSATARLI